MLQDENVIGLFVPGVYCMDAVIPTDVLDWRERCQRIDETRIILLERQVDHAGTEFIDEVPRRVERDEPSVIDDAHTVAEGLRLLHVVGGIDDRDPFVTIEALDALEDV